MKKQLLSESEIRKMMKFANIGSLASPFVERLNENYESGADLEEGMHEDEDDDEANEGMYAEGMHEDHDDTHEGMHEDEDDTNEGMPMEEEEDMDDAGMEGDDDGAPGDMAMGADKDSVLQGVEEFIKAAVMGFRERGMDDIADAIGLDVEGAEGEADDMAMDEPMDADPMAGAPEGDDAPEADAPGAPALPGAPGGADEEDDMGADLEEADLYMEDDQAVVAEVARRVAKRLLQAKRRR